MNVRRILVPSRLDTNESYSTVRADFWHQHPPHLRRGGIVMKLLQGTLQPSGYRVSCLIDPEDLDLLRFEDTGEMPEGLDFALLWNGVWREGRCYASFSGRTFVTYGDAQRLPLHTGMQTRRSNYALEPEHLLELPDTYARELGHTSTQPGEIGDLNTTIE